MSLTLAQIRVPIHSSWKPGDTLQLYTDEGDGSIDTSKGLLANPVPVFPGQNRALGYGAFGYGTNPYGDDTGNDRRAVGGYGDAPYGDQPYGESASYVTVWLDVEDTFDTWLFTAQVTSGAGIVQTDSLVNFTVVMAGEDPEPPVSFSFTSLSSGVATFAIA